MRIAREEVDAMTGVAGDAGRLRVQYRMKKKENSLALD